MLLPIGWLKKYVEINTPIRDMADAITASGSHVESIESRGEEIDRVVTGKILRIEKHPNADKLVVCLISIGEEEKTIVTGAPNVYKGANVALALDGATIADGKKIFSSDFRGIMSDGMLCSYEELGYPVSVIPKEYRDGVLLLEKDVPLGVPIQKILEMDEEVLDLEITPNRPDCLSILGMARETAASTDTKFREPEITLKEEGEKDISELFSGLDVASDKVPRFYGKVLTDIMIGPSPQWLQNDLMAAGVRPINNIVDLTNYVMLEYGQPLHAYDLDVLRENRISVRQAEEGERFMTLDGEERSLREEDIVIADGEGVIGLAGIMGGLDSEITEKTTSVFLEGANFSKKQVRKTSKRLGLRTEASTRFEKGLDPEKAKLAVNRVCQLVEELGCGNVATGAVDYYPDPVESVVVESDINRINALLGTDLSGETMKNYLERLSIDTKLEGQTLKSTIPSDRLDLGIWQDIAEEVGRLYNFHNIKPMPLSGALTRGGRPKFRNVEDRAKEVFQAAGFSEFMTYSFMSPGAFDRLHLPDDSPLRKAVKLINPLGEEYSVMRTTLLPNMIDILSKNMDNGNDHICGYEFGNVFSLPEKKGELPKESLRLALGFYGKKDFYFLKEVIVKVLHHLGLKDLKVSREQENSLFHRGQCANIYVGDVFLGTFGQIHPFVAQTEGMKKRAFLGELDFETILEYVDDQVIYQPLHKYPSIERDVAMIVDRDVEAGAMIEHCKEVGTNLLSDVRIFDVYVGKGVEEGKKSMAFTFTFRDPERTLVDDEADTITKQLIHSLEEKFQARLRS